MRHGNSFRLRVVAGAAISTMYLLLFAGIAPCAHAQSTVYATTSTDAFGSAGSAIDRVTLDSAGNLYEALQLGGAFGYGQVLKLTPSGGNWIYTDLYDFTNGSDGGSPLGSVMFDSSGNLYGTTELGNGTGCGGFGCGTVWSITAQ